ncbi:heparan-alpha-glucosaminide N-acetyltransferase domain-containing protein [Psychrosphaera algicola]|uniref:heparan-alpha-glucosaminide N-acetyltransferase domain-containing protein n=1 Tax=Psychrosphaera algicola TaxID=3023714 RepID=UPI00351D5703
MKNQRLLELDALRGLAALAVVCYHYFYRYNELYGHESVNVGWSHIGKFGVELFLWLAVLLYFGH